MRDSKPSIHFQDDRDRPPGPGGGGAFLRPALSHEPIFAARKSEAWGQDRAAVAARRVTDLLAWAVERSTGQSFVALRASSCGRSLAAEHDAL